MLKNKKILLVGLGRMGSALAHGWVIASKSVKEKNLTIIEPAAKSIDFDNAKLLKNSEELARSYRPDIIFFAVKPQNMAEVLPDYKKYNNALFISIAAGKTISFMEKYLGKDKAIIRAMPNLAATISKGTTVLAANKNVSNDAGSYAVKLFKAVGNTHWVDKEKHIDAVTAVSGSGPAYMFHFIDCFIGAAVQAGLSEKLALSLVYETINGSIALANFAGQKSLKNLRDGVTSPGGTTEAAFKILDKNEALRKLIEAAVIAAKNRSEELSD